MIPNCSLYAQKIFWRCQTFQIIWLNRFFASGRVLCVCVCVAFSLLWYLVVSRGFVPNGIESMHTVTRVSQSLYIIRSEKQRRISHGTATNSMSDRKRETNALTCPRCTKLLIYSRGSIQWFWGSVRRAAWFFYPFLAPTLVLLPHLPFDAFYRTNVIWLSICSVYFSIIPWANAFNSLLVALCWGLCPSISVCPSMLSNNNTTVKWLSFGKSRLYVTTPIDFSPFHVME